MEIKKHNSILLTKTKTKSHEIVVFIIYSTYKLSYLNI